MCGEAVKKITVDDILAIICNVFDAYSVVLFVGDDSGLCKLVSYFSLGNSIDSEVKITPGHGLAGWIVKEGQTLIVNNFDQKKNFLGYYKDGAEASIKSFMGCPLTEKTGVLCLDSKKQYSFTTKDQKIFQQFVTFLSGFLGIFSRHSKLQNCVRYYRTFQTLLTLREKFPRWEPFLKNFLNILSTGSGFSTVFLTAADDWEQTFWVEGVNADTDLGIPSGEKIKIGSGLIGWIFKNQVPVFLGDERSHNRRPGSLFGGNISTPDYGTVICLPVMVDKKIRAVLTLADLDELAISKDIKSFCSMVTDHLSLFLENLYLKDLARTPLKKEESTQLR